MGRKIVITSGKGGVGKTTVVSRLGVTRSQLGYKTMLVDMDFGLNNLDVLMGIENKIVYDIIDVIEGRCLPKQAIIQDMVEDNLYILPSINTYCKRKFGFRELLEILGEVEDLFDFILIDCPAGIDGGFVRAVHCAIEHIIVTTPHLSAIRDADKVLSNIQLISKNTPKIIINRVRGDLIIDGEMLSVSSVCEYLSGELIGVIPEDDCVSRQLYKGCNFSISTDLNISFELIAKNILGLTNRVFDCTTKYKGVLGSIRKKLKRSL